MFCEIITAEFPAVTSTKTQLCGILFYISANLFYDPNIGTNLGQSFSRNSYNGNFRYRIGLEEDEKLM